MSTPVEDSETKQAKEKHQGRPKLPKFLVETIKPGDSTHYPEKGQTVRVHYEGWVHSQKGDKFDSSRERGRPLEAEVGVGKLIKGWDEGIMKMSIGQIAKITIPPNMAYGVRGYPPIEKHPKTEMAKS